MKKRIIFAVTALLLMFTSIAGVSAAEYNYELNNMKITTDSISVDVTKVSESSDAAVLYVAMYDEYNMLLGVKSQVLSLEKDNKTSIPVELRANSAVTVKAFVWEKVLVPKSKIVYKTTRIEGDIEYGGEV